MIIDSLNCLLVIIRSTGRIFELLQRNYFRYRFMETDRNKTAEERDKDGSTSGIKQRFVVT